MYAVFKVEETHRDGKVSAESPQTLWHVLSLHREIALTVVKTEYLLVYYCYNFVLLHTIF